MNNRQGKITPRRGGRGPPPFSAGRKSPSPPAPEKALPLLGIARRAGRLALGMDPAVEAMQKQKAFLLLLSPDLSSRSRKRVQEQAERYGAELMEIPFGMDEIGTALGKRSGIIAVCDGGFAGKLKELLAFAGQRTGAPGGAPATEETEEESHL